MVIRSESSTILQESMSVLMEAVFTLREIVEEDARLLDSWNSMPSIMDIIPMMLFSKLLVPYLLIKKLYNKTFKLKKNDVLISFLYLFTSNPLTN